MSVIVVHPQVQHSFQLARALHEAGLLGKFYTSIFLTPDALNNYPSLVQEKLRRRACPIPRDKVSTFPWIELLWRLTKVFLAPKWQGVSLYYSLMLFDSWAAQRVAADAPRIVVGFENSSSALFREAKRIGAVCVLDAASVHFNYQAKARNAAAGLLQSKIDLRKAEEISLADRILVLSAFAKQTYIEAGIPSEKLVTIVLGADIELFSQKPSRVSTSSFNYLFVGNLTREKGVDLLLAAFESIDVPGKTLTLVGAKYGRLPDSINRSRNVRWAGYLSPEALRDEYQRADVFVLPSRLDGFGMVVAEAMATGTPVIVSSAVGAKDLVRDGETGWVFESESVAALKGAMERSYRDRGRLEQMGIQARATVVSDYTWEAYRRRIGAFYADLLKSAPHQRPLHIDR